MKSKAPRAYGSQNEALQLGPEEQLNCARRISRSWPSFFPSSWECLRAPTLSQSHPGFKEKKSMSTFEPNTKRGTLGSSSFHFMAKSRP